MACLFRFMFIPFRALRISGGPVWGERAGGPGRAQGIAPTMDDRAWWAALVFALACFFRFCSYEVPAGRFGVSARAA